MGGLHLPGGFEEQQQQKIFAPLLIFLPALEFSFWVIDSFIALLIIPLLNNEGISEECNLLSPDICQRINIYKCIDQNNN